MPGRPQIACIDDDPFVREALEGLLLSMGYAALVFASAEEFLNYAGLRNLACLITDIKLGGISGLELLGRLAAGGHAIPAIVITAFGDEALREKSLAAGAVGFLSKPVRGADLFELIERALGRSSPS